VQRIKVKMSKVPAIENQLQNLCFQDPEIKYLGQRVRVAFFSLSSVSAWKLIRELAGVRVVLALDTPTQ
jgi:ATP-dependent RNA helicase DDX10/DBP4